jgi:hypothetical protein
MVSMTYSVVDHNLAQDCPECGLYVLPQDETCKSCHLDFNSSFYASSVATYSTKQMDYDDSNYDTNDLYDDIDLDDLYAIYLTDSISSKYKLGEVPDQDDCVLCNEDIVKCTCTSPQLFKAIYLYFEDQFLHKTANDVAVEDVSYFANDVSHYPLCSSCEDYGTYRCKSFRTFLRFAYENPDILEDNGKFYDLIEPCEEFTPNSRATLEDVNEVNVYIQDKKKDQVNAKNSFNRNNFRINLSYDSPYWEY